MQVCEFCASLAEFYLYYFHPRRKSIRKRTIIVIIHYYIYMITIKSDNKCVIGLNYKKESDEYLGGREMLIWLLLIRLS